MKQVTPGKTHCPPEINFIQSVPAFSHILMKTKFVRPFLASLCCVLVACVNPYLAQMDRVEMDYRSGRISRAEYNREMDSLDARSNAWAAQNSANVAMGASAIAAAAIVGGALIEAEANEDVAHAINHNHRSSARSGDNRGGSPKKSAPTKSKKPQGGSGPPQGGGGPQGGGPPAGGAGGPGGKRPPPQ